MTDHAMTPYEEIGSPMSPETVKQQIQVIQKVMREAMVAEVHFGVIPGTNKPTLLKAGAEKLCLTFRLSPTYAVIKSDLGQGHREYEVRCTLTHIPSGKVFGEGVGICSTMETKFRYRGPAFEETGEPIPKDAKENKAEYRKQGFGMKKVNDKWVWVKYGERQENPDIADTFNTVLKMAKKRAHVDAVLTATAASDIFTQDLEDLVEDTNGETKTEKTPNGKANSRVVPKEHDTSTDESWRLDFKEALTKLCGNDASAVTFLGTHGYESWDQVPTHAIARDIYKAKAKEKA